MHFAILTLLSLVALQGAVTEDVCLLSDKQTFRLETPSGARPDGTSPSFCSPDGLTGHVSSFEQHWFFHREKIGAPWEGVLHAELDTPRMTGGWLERSGRWYYKPYPDYPTAVGVASGSIATLDAHTRIMYPHSMRALKQEEEQRFTANTAQEHIIKHIQACCDFGDVEDFRPQVSYFGSHRKASLYAYGYTDSPRRSRLWIHDLAEGLSHEVELGGDCGNRIRGQISSHGLLVPPNRDCVIIHLAPHPDGKYIWPECVQLLTSDGRFVRELFSIANEGKAANGQVVLDGGDSIVFTASGGVQIRRLLHD